VQQIKSGKFGDADLWEFVAKIGESFLLSWHGKT